MEMKKLRTYITLAFLGLVILGVNAQQNAIDKYYQDYRQDDRFTHVSVSSKMFELFLNFEREDPSEQQVIEIIGKLRGLKVLVGSNIEDARGMFSSAVAIPYNDMEELMEITESEKELRFFISETAGKVDELLMVGYEHSQVIMLSIFGDIDLKEIALLSQKMNIDGFEHFENIND
jgi:hypothetical protein